MGYLVSAVDLVSCSSYVGSILRNEISFFLWSICTDVSISTKKGIFVPIKIWKWKRARESNPISQTLYTYLSKSIFLANLTLPNKQSFKLKSEF